MENIRFLVYRKKEGNKRYTHIRISFNNLEDALIEAGKYNGGYVLVCDYTGKELSDKIYPNK